MSDLVRLEDRVQMLAEACPGQSARTWDLIRTVLSVSCGDPRIGGGPRYLFLI